MAQKQAVQNDEAVFEPWANLGLIDTACPACGDISCQPAGLFYLCNACGLELGDQCENLLSEHLQRCALHLNRGGALA